MTIYGVALALAFLAGIAVAKRRAALAGLDSDRVVILSLLILVTSIAGSRALYVLTHLDRLTRGLGDALVASEGLSMLGGVVLALGSALLWLRARGLPVLRYADALAPSVALGEAITRVGCFLDGCCAGTPIAEGSPHLHPTPLYLGALALGSFALLVRLAPGPGPAGRVLFAMLVLLGTARLLVDPLRAYEGEAIAASNSLIAGALAAVGVAGLWALRSQSSRFSSQCTSQ